jgi:hypothetical protein
MRLRHAREASLSISAIEIAPCAPWLFFCRHCEERSDEAIQTFAAVMVWIASLRSQ